MLSAQYPFSKIHYYDDLNSHFFKIEPLEDGRFLILGGQNKPSEFLKVGWFLVDGDGNMIDTFLFKESWTSMLTLNNQLVRGDTVLQIFRPIGHQKEIRVYGSSISQRDSIFTWVHDWSYIDKLREVRPRTMTINSRGNIVVISNVLWETPGGPSVYLTEMDLSGEILLKKKVKTFAPDEWHRNYSRFTISSKIVEINNHYYVACGVDVDWDNSFVLKMTKEGEIVWQSDLSLNASSIFEFDIAPTGDSSGIAWTTNRQLDLADVDNDFEKYWSLSAFPASITFLDTADGSIRREHVEYRDIDNFFYANRMIRSRFNDDFIMCGAWEQIDPDNDLIVWEGGMVARVCEEEGFKWIKFIPELWDYQTISVYFWNLTEADNEDIVLVGTSRRLQPPTRRPGWIMRIGPDGCVPGHTFCSGDSLLIAHPGVMVHVDEMSIESHPPMVSPNPVRQGEPIRINFGDQESTMAGVMIRWYSIDGNLLPMTEAFTVYPDGVVSSLPRNISPGMYILELMKEGRKYRMKVMVLE
ncbi:MAG: T9SS C-terminal target domain-containing protein [Saprospirales bacterium]|nr:MAG: T9SS C-terminal target domain-containing protein [Saprospirales bacterium]